jgi:glutathione S-transferase
MTTATALPQLTLYDFPSHDTQVPGWSSLSPFVLQVDRALRLAKLPYERVVADMFKLKQLNPTGQLPVLRIGDELVADSTRIMHRIEALEPGALTAGLDAAQLAEAWLWEEFADTSLYPHLLAVRWVDERGWPVPRKAFFGGLPAPVRAVVAPMVRRQTLAKLIGRDFLRGGLEACYERMGRILDALEARAPSTGFWLGARASVADLGLFAQLHQLRLPLLPWQAEQITRRARLNAYLDRVDAVTRG